MPILYIIFLFSLTLLIGPNIIEDKVEITDGLRWYVEISHVGRCLRTSCKDGCRYCVVVSVNNFVVLSIVLFPNKTAELTKRTSLGRASMAAVVHEIGSIRQLGQITNIDQYKLGYCNPYHLHNAEFRSRQYMYYMLENSLQRYLFLVCLCRHSRRHTSNSISLSTNEQRPPHPQVTFPFPTTWALVVVFIFPVALFLYIVQPRDMSQKSKFPDMPDIFMP